MHLLMQSQLPLLCMPLFLIPSLKPLTNQPPLAVVGGALSSCTRFWQSLISDRAETETCPWCLYSFTFKDLAWAKNTGRCHTRMRSHADGPAGKGKQVRSSSVCEASNLQPPISPASALCTARHSGIPPNHAQLHCRANGGQAVATGWSVNFASALCWLSEARSMQRCLPCVAEHASSWKGELGKNMSEPSLLLHATSCCFVSAALSIVPAVSADWPAPSLGS